MDGSGWGKLTAVNSYDVLCRFLICTNFVFHRLVEKSIVEFRSTGSLSLLDVKASDLFFNVVIFEIDCEIRFHFNERLESSFLLLHLTHVDEFLSWVFENQQVELKIIEFVWAQSKSVDRTFLKHILLRDSLHILLVWELPLRLINLNNSHEVQMWLEHQNVRWIQFL